MPLIELRDGLTRLDMTDDEMLALMDGHPPPENKSQRAAYFAVFEQRVVAMYGRRALDDLMLLAGCAPEAYAEFDRQRMRRNG